MNQKKLNLQGDLHWTISAILLTYHGLVTPCGVKHSDQHRFENNFSPGRHQASDLTKILLI